MVEAVRFPDIPLYQGWGAPLRSETDVRDLEGGPGRHPPELNGALLRCGPDRQYPPATGEDIFIDGEGMVHMFRFEDGHADYRSRWVHTERFRTAGRGAPVALRPLPQPLHQRPERGRGRTWARPTPT